MSGGRLSRQTAILILGTGVQSVIAQMGVNLFLVRLLDSPEAFGSYRQVWLVINTLLPVFLLGLHLGLYYYLPSLAAGARRRFVMGVLGLLLLSGLGLSLGIHFGADALGRFFNNPDLPPLLRAMAFYPLFINPAMLLYHFHIAEGRASRAAWINIAFFLVQSVAIVGMAAAGVPLGPLFLVLVGLALLRLLHAFLELRTFTIPDAGLPGGVAVGPLLAYSLPVGMAATVAIVGEKLDKFVISSALDPASFALYSVGAVEFPLIVLVATAAGTVLRPRVSALHHAGRSDEILGLWGEATRKLAVVLLPMGIYLALVAGEFIEFLYTPEYGAAASIFRLFLPLAFLRGLPLEPLLTSMGRTRVILGGGLGFLALDLVLNLVLVKILGIHGPPVATVLATTALAGLYLGVAARGLGVSPVRLVPFGTILRVAGAAAVALAAALAVKGMPDGRLGVLLVTATVFGPVYLVCVRMLGGIRPGDLSGILRSGNRAGGGDA